MKVLFVCLGNICRSPLAHRLFELEVEKRGIHSVMVDSCGCSGWHSGELPDRRMREEAAGHGVKLTHHARKISRKDGEEFDYIFAMDEEIYERIFDVIEEKYWKKVKRFREWDSQGAGEDVPDPYYGGAEGFSLVYDICLRNCSLIADKILCND